MLSTEPFLNSVHENSEPLSCSKEFQEAITESCLDDSTKIIRYLEEQEQKQKSYRVAVLIFTLISTIGGIIAAVTGIIGLLK